MSREDTIKENITLKDKIASLPDGSILFRSDYPEYHSEFVGSTLAELTDDGILSKIAQGIYVKPTKSRFGLVFPSVEKVVQAIATRDNAQILTSGSERTIKLKNHQVVLKRGVPKNFSYKTRLIALLAQALRTLKQENIGNSELQIIRELISKETDKENLAKDIDILPIWMKKIIKPMLNN